MRLGKETNEKTTNGCVADKQKHVKRYLSLPSGNRRYVHVAAETKENERPPCCSEIHPYR
jgi:hypothetical protein